MANGKGRVSRLKKREEKDFKLSNRRKKFLDSVIKGISF